MVLAPSSRRPSRWGYREQVHARLADEGVRQRIQQLSTEAPDSRGRILQLLDGMRFDVLPDSLVARNSSPNASTWTSDQHHHLEHLNMCLCCLFPLLDCGLVNEVVESLRLDENDFEPTLQCQTERASVAPGRAESVSSRIADVLKGTE